MSSSVYVGERASLAEVGAAVKAWQAQTGDTTRVFIEGVDPDSFPGMGTAIDIYGDSAEEHARRVTEGIRPLLDGVPVMLDSEYYASTS